jgi:hypothetical protein
VEPAPTLGGFHPVRSRSPAHVRRPAQATREAAHAHCSFVGLDERSEACGRGELPRLDARRVRFLPHGVRAQGHRGGIPHGHRQRDGCDPADLGDAAGRCLPVRARGRPLGAPSHPDGRRPVLFRDRIRVRLCAQPHGAAGAARDLRHRDGRRMGGRGVAHHGVDPAAGARIRVGPAAVGLSGRLFSRLDRVRPVLPVYRLARHVHDRRRAGAARVLHPPPRSRIAGLASGGDGRQHGCGAALALAARALRG